MTGFRRIVSLTIAAVNLFVAISSSSLALVQWGCGGYGGGWGGCGAYGGGYGYNNGAAMAGAAIGGMELII